MAKKKAIAEVDPLLGVTPLASPDPVTTDWIPMWGPTPNTLPQDTVIAAAVRIVANRLAAGDANNAWQVRGDGRMDWGAGGGAALDANLYRGAANRLRTDSNLHVQGAIALDLTDSVGTAALFFGSAFDTKLYRSAAGQLKTDGSLIAGPSPTLFVQRVSAVPSGVPHMEAYGNTTDGSGNFSYSYVAPFPSVAAGACTGYNGSGWWIGFTVANGTVHNSTAGQPAWLVTSGY